MNKVKQYYSDDYAVLTADTFRFYYGYEKEDTVTEEWMFTVTKDGKEIYSLTTSDILNQCNSERLRMPQDYLLAGMGVWLSNIEQL